MKGHPPAADLGLRAVHVRRPFGHPYPVGQQGHLLTSRHAPIVSPAERIQGRPLKRDVVIGVLRNEEGSFGAPRPASGQPCSATIMAPARTA